MTDLAPTQRFPAQDFAATAARLHCRACFGAQHCARQQWPDEPALSNLPNSICTDRALLGTIYIALRNRENTLLLSRNRAGVAFGTSEAFEGFCFSLAPEGCKPKRDAGSNGSAGF